MFDILEADIVVFQETKIQPKDLNDDMVLVPGWDCYFSLPKYKKGYSGVVIYTRQSVCSPIRAEEGVTGRVCPPGSSTAFCDLPLDQQIGGYPSEAQLARGNVNAATLDSEGRCVILEFPAFVLLGVYSPAARDETRDDFRLGFLDVLDARIRNLAALGKRVFLTGDLNISREELDAANAEVSMMKQGLTGLEFVSTPARRLFNQLLEGGKVFGDRDAGRESSVLWDICRAFHPNRKGMFTCWDQKTNARPANCGARIDYVLSSSEMKTWFTESNIQEGLMGSDHCPVYAIFKSVVEVGGEERHLLDIMNLPGMFVNGQRTREYQEKRDPLPMSGRLIPGFSGRVDIRNMFSRKPSVPSFEPQRLQIANPSTPTSLPTPTGQKRNLPTPQTAPSPKKMKGNMATKPSPAPGKGQRSLRGFLKPTEPATPVPETALETSINDEASEAFGKELALLGGDTSPGVGQASAEMREAATSSASGSATAPTAYGPLSEAPSMASHSDGNTDDAVHDPIENKESWSKLFSTPVAPRCRAHDEPCTRMLSRKAGMNFKRSFWMCPRPVGPSGAKESQSEWRCHTFIWCSDWNASAGTGNRS